MSDKTNEVVLEVPVKYALHHPEAELVSPATGKVLVQEHALRWLISFFLERERSISPCLHLDLFSIKKTSTTTQPVPLTPAKPRSSKPAMTALRRQLVFLLYVRSKFPLLFRLY